MEGALLERLNRAGLARSADQLVRLAKPSIRLHSTSIDEEDAPLGSSRIGGSADLQQSDRWPDADGVPLSFVAQINFAETKGFDPLGQLPNKGIALFFYDATNQPWGFSPEDRGSWKIIYYERRTSLSRVQAPDELNELARTYPRALSFASETTLPPLRSLSVDRLGLNDAEIAAYSSLTRHDSRKSGPDHHLLGHPAAIQNDMQLQCQLVTHGLYCGDPYDCESPQRASLESGSGEWQLLLQIDSDEWASMEWGDGGRIYFWIRNDDLRRRRFDDIWVILQCY